MLEDVLTAKILTVSVFFKKENFAKKGVIKFAVVFIFTLKENFVSFCGIFSDIIFINSTCF